MSSYVLYIEVDRICLQSWFSKGLNILAMIITMGTSYGCNLSIKGDLLCLQSRIRNGPYIMHMIYACNLIQWGPNMLAIIENVFS